MQHRLFTADGTFDGFILPCIRGTILGVPIIRIIIFWGLYWGPPLFCQTSNPKPRGREPERTLGEILRPQEVIN